MSIRTIPLGSVAANVATDVATGIVSEVNAILQSAGPGNKLERSASLLKAAQSGRQKLLRLLVALQWYKSKANFVDGCSRVFPVVDWHMKEIIQAADRLCHLQPELEYLSNAPFDVQTAWEVLTEGAPQTVPAAIRDLGGYEATAGRADALRRLNFTLRAELLRTGLPPHVRVLKVEDGRATLACPGEYTAVVTLAPYQPPPLLSAPSAGPAETVAYWNLEELAIHVRTPLSDLDERHVATRLAVSKLMLDTAVAAAAATRKQRAAAASGPAPAPAATTPTGSDLKPQISARSGRSNFSQPSAAGEADSRAAAPSAPPFMSLLDSELSPTACSLQAMHGTLHEIAVGLAFANLAESARRLCHERGSWDGLVAYDALVPTHPDLAPGLQIAYWLKGPWRAWVGAEGPPRLELGIGRRGAASATSSAPQLQLQVQHVPRLAPGIQERLQASLDATSTDVEPFVRSAMAAFGGDCLERLLRAVAADERGAVGDLERSVRTDPSSGLAEASFSLPSTSTPLLTITLNHAGRLVLSVGADLRGSGLQLAALQAIARTCQTALNSALGSADDPTRVLGVLASDLTIHLSSMMRLLEREPVVRTCATLGLCLVEGSRQAAVLAAAKVAGWEVGDRSVPLLFEVPSEPSTSSVQDRGMECDDDDEESGHIARCLSKTYLLQSAQHRMRRAEGAPMSPILLRAVQHNLAGAPVVTAVPLVEEEGCWTDPTALRAMLHRTPRQDRLQEFLTAVLDAGLPVPLPSLSESSPPTAFSFPLADERIVSLRLLSGSEGRWNASLDLTHLEPTSTRAPIDWAEQELIGTPALEGSRLVLNYTLAKGQFPFHLTRDLRRILSCEAFVKEALEAAAAKDGRFQWTHIGLTHATAATAPSAVAVEVTLTWPASTANAAAAPTLPPSFSLFGGAGGGGAYSSNAQRLGPELDCAAILPSMTASWQPILTSAASDPGAAATFAQLAADTAPILAALSDLDDVAMTAPDEGIYIRDFSVPAGGNESSARGRAAFRLDLATCEGRAVLVLGPYRAREQAARRVADACATAADLEGAKAPSIRVDMSREAATAPGEAGAGPIARQGAAGTAEPDPGSEVDVEMTPLSKHWVRAAVRRQGPRAEEAPRWVRVIVEAAAKEVTAPSESEP